MKTTFCSLIVISPQNRWSRKIQISRPAMFILAAVFILSFFTSVLLALSFSSLKVNEADRDRLAAENQTLKIENTNIEFRTRKLNTQLSRVEELSKRVTDLMEAD